MNQKKKYSANRIPKLYIHTLFTHTHTERERKWPKCNELFFFVLLVFFSVFMVVVVVVVIGNFVFGWSWDVLWVPWVFFLGAQNYSVSAAAVVVKNHHHHRFIIEFLFTIHTFLLLELEIDWILFFLSLSLSSFSLINNLSEINPKKWMNDSGFSLFVGQKWKQFFFIFFSFSF